MNVYLIACRSGKIYYVSANYATSAILWVEINKGEAVSSWDMAYSIPKNATVENALLIAR